MGFSVLTLGSVHANDSEEVPIHSPAPERKAKSVFDCVMGEHHMFLSILSCYVANICGHSSH